MKAHMGACMGGDRNFPKFNEEEDVGCCMLNSIRHFGDLTTSELVRILVP